MHITCYSNFNKRINSTKQPYDGEDKSVRLKEPTSIVSPVFILEDYDLSWNYMKWNDKYYFVDDVVIVHNNIAEYHCSCDVLATYKSYILNTTAYILYDSVINTELPDNRLPMKTTKNVQVSTVACPFTVDSGCYILSITGSNDSTGVYKVTESQLSKLIDDIADVNDNLFDFPTSPPAPTYNSGNDWAAIAENIGIACDTLVSNFKFLRDCLKYTVSQFFGSGNIPENIRECRYIPFNVGTTTGNTPVYLGTFKTKQSLPKLNTETVHRTVNVSIPWQSIDYRRRSPYTEIYLYLPYIGMTKLSSENLIGQSSVTVAYTLSMRSGSIIVTVSSGGEILGQYGGNVGASVPIGMSNVSLPKVAGSAIATMGTAIATSSSGGSLAPVGMAVLNFHESITPNFSTIGGLDGIAGIGANQNITCYTVYHDTIVPPNTELMTVGSPSMCPKLIGTLTGFCQCLEGHVEAPADAKELVEIDSYINSGFYIE